MFSIELNPDNRNVQKCFPSHVGRTRTNHYIMNPFTNKQTVRTTPTRLPFAQRRQAILLSSLLSVFLASYCIFLLDESECYFCLIFPSVKH